MIKLPDSWKERREKRKEQWKQIGTNLGHAVNEFKDIPRKISEERTKERNKSEDVKQLEKKILLTKFNLVIWLPFGIFVSWLVLQFSSDYYNVIVVWVAMIIILIWEIRKLLRLTKRKSI